MKTTLSRKKSFRRAFVPLAAALAIGGLGARANLAEAATNPWESTSLTPAQRADSLLAAMTQTEKLAMLHGGSSCGYVGCVDGNTRLGIPALHLQDGPVGVGDGATGVTQLPAPVVAAATWDVSLARKYGEVLGAEQWAKGVNIALAPTINIVRDPRWGRAFESFGEDPFLTGKVGSADILGIQSQGPMAQVKHFAAYNQETNRFNAADDAIVSDRALREIYLPAFERTINEGLVDSVMCSYNLINDVHACEDGPMLNGILKGDMGFTGFVTADWGATHSTLGSANGGLDMEMPDSKYFGSALTTAVGNGQVSTAVIDDKVRRILTSMFRQGLFDKTQPGNLNAVATSSAHTTVARQVAIEGSVLLKNGDGILPLTTATRSIAVIGDGGSATVVSEGGGSAGVRASAVVSPYQGIKARAGTGANVTYYSGTTRADGSLPTVDSAYLTPSSGSGHGASVAFYNGATLSGPVITSRVDPTIDYNWQAGSPASGVSASAWSARWNATPPVSGTYTVSLTSDDGSRLVIDGAEVIDGWFAQASTTRTAAVALTAGKPVRVQIDYFQNGGGSNLSFGWTVPGESLHDQAVNAARTADVAVVFATKTESEGSDIGDISFSAAQNQLIADVAAANPRTVVVVNSGSAVAMPWVNSVKAVVASWYPGQEYGNALAALLFGDQNFSGKLPVTFPKSLADVPAHTTAQFPGTNNTVQYSEGIDVGYRWYDRNNLEPLFPFGFGLSYTTFGYANLSVGARDASGNVAVSFDVTNTGGRAGAEVAEVYVGQPANTGEPPKSLAGFERVVLNPGQTQHVALTLEDRAFRYWNGGWALATGSNQILVGGSSRSLPLKGQVTIAQNGSGPANGTYTAAPQSSPGKTLDDRGASVATGNPIAIWTPNGTAAQRWNFSNVGVQPAGDYRVAVSLGNYCMTASSTSSGAPVNLQACNGSPSQAWHATSASGGSFTLSPASSTGLCLDVKAAGTADGTLVQVYSCNGTSAQRWNLK